MNKCLLCVLTAVCAHFAAVPTHADTVAFAAIAGDGGQDYLAVAGDTLGYSFTLAGTTTVTQVGFYDYNGDGLSAATPVTIWNAGGTALASATVPAGTNSNELNGYLYVTLGAPVTLPAGTYTIGGYDGSNSDYVGFFATITPASGITYGGSRSGGGTADPTGDPNNFSNSYFGPNFQFGVPEPSTWVAIAAGAFLLGVASPRRHVVRAPKRQMS